VAKRNASKESSENVYADLGFPNPELEQAKAALAREIRSIIDVRGMTQTEAGELLGVDQADISRITRGRLGGYTLDRLLTMLFRLDVRVEIRVHPPVAPVSGTTGTGTELLETSANELQADGAARVVEREYAYT
jgi:predicted XRE-type DNA-binding protein